jgi:hypothetical protein
LTRGGDGVHVDVHCRRLFPTATTPVHGRCRKTYFDTLGESETRIVKGGFIRPIHRHTSAGSRRRGMMRTGKSVRATLSASPDMQRRQPTPETRLLIAILEEAINCFQKNYLAEHDSGQRLFREADEWLMGNRGDWAFSFESICDAIGLNPSYVRYGLRQWQARQPRG